MDVVDGGDVLFLCATNCPWELDPAFLRRFQRKIFIGLPSKYTLKSSFLPYLSWSLPPCLHRDDRCELLRLHLGSTGVALSGKDLQVVADLTEGYSGCDIAHLVSEALLRPLRELQAAQHWLPVGGQLQPCSPGRPGALHSSLCDLCPEQVQPAEPLVR